MDSRILVLRRSDITELLSLGECVQAMRAAFVMYARGKALAPALMHVDAYAELGDVLAGKAVGRADADEIIVFDATGSAIQDTAAAVAVYERAVARGIGSMIELYQRSLRSHYLKRSQQPTTCRTV